MTTGSPNPVPQLPFDLSKGQPIVAIETTGSEAVASMRVQQLLSVVPDPAAAEDPKRTATDPVLAQYAGLRKEVQRAVQGAKARNAVSFARYLIEGLQRKRPFITPAITLYHPKALERVALGQGVAALILPYGEFLVAIDGETQRIAWQLAARELPDALGHVVKVVIHHGMSIDEAKQGFYDLNTKEVKPNAALAIAMDTMDIATRMTRRLMEESSVLQNRVNLQRRQLKRTDEDVLTISALRTGVVTTILGAAGLQIGNRSIEELPDETDLDKVERAVLDVWIEVLDMLSDELNPQRRPESVVSAPSTLAGIGILAHRTLPTPPRNAELPEKSVDEVLELLDSVIWDRTSRSAKGGAMSVWEGIAGKFTPKGTFSIAGPKEVGHAIAQALFDPDCESGRQIRGLLPPLSARGLTARGESR